MRRPASRARHPHGLGVARDRLADRPPASTPRAATSSRVVGFGARRPMTRSVRDPLELAHTPHRTRLDGTTEAGRQPRGRPRRWSSRSPAGSGSTASSRSERRAASNSPVTSSRSSTGCSPRSSVDQVGLGQDQRQERPPLLALRAEAAQVAAGVVELEVVQVRARPRWPPARCHGRPVARAVSSAAQRLARGVREQPQRLAAGVAAELRQPGRRTPARAARTAARGRRSARPPPRAVTSSHAHQRLLGRRARARTRRSRWFRCASARAYSAAAALGQRRPQPHEHAVEVRAAKRRRALHQPHPVGREHQHREAAEQTARPSARRRRPPSTRFGSPGRNPTRPVPRPWHSSASASTRMKSCPNAISRRSSDGPRRVGERSAKWIISIRLVLPAPLGPTTPTSPGGSSTSTRS